MTPDGLAAYADEIFNATRKLIEMAPEDKWNWKPGANNYMTLGQVCCHLSSATGGIMNCFLTGQWPEIASPDQMLPAAEKLPTCPKSEALKRLEEDRKQMHRVLAEVSRSDFDGKILETPWGEKGPMWLMFLKMVEHQCNHKMQLFQYLKLLNLPVNTMHLYGMAQPEMA